MRNLCPLFYFLLLFNVNTSLIFSQTDQNESFITLDDAEDRLLNENDSMAHLDTEPMLISFVKADYPDSLISSGIEGTVLMSLLVNEHGHIDSVSIITGLHPVLNSLAAKAASQFVFSPGIADGKPVPVYITYKYTFTLDDVYEKIPDYTNVTGRIIEKGTGKKVADAIVIAVFNYKLDKKSDSVGTDIVVLGKDTLPLDRYLKKIGAFKGQTLEAGQILTTTDSLGNFKFSSLPPGKVLLKIVINDFDIFKSEVEVNRDETVDLVYRVERTSYDDYEIVVYGKDEVNEVSRRSLSVQEAKRIPGFDGDVIKAVQALPGVARPVFGGNEIIIRGADWDDNKYFIDGIEIPYVWHDFIYPASVLNKNVIDNIQLHSGGFGVRYGNVLGGVIDINSRRAKKDRWHGIADINLNYSSLFLEIPFSEKFSFIGSARREYSMAVTSWMAKTFADEDVDIGAYYWDYSLRFDYSPNKNHSLFGSFLSAKDTLYQINIRKDDDFQDDFKNGKRFNLGILGWDWKISDRLNNSLRYGIGPITGKYDIETSDMEYNTDLSGFKHSIRNDFSFTPNKKIDFLLGVDLQLAPTALKYKSEGFFWEDYEKKDTSFTENVDFLLGSVGGFLSCEIKPFEKLSIKPEYRLDYYPGLQYEGSLVPEFWNYDHSTTKFRWSYEPSFRLSTRYGLFPKHTLKGSLGTYNKSPEYAANDRWGNPELEPSRGTKYSLGYEWQMSDLISLDIQGYINRQWNKPQYMWGIELEDDEEGRFVNRGKGRMRGLEFFLRHDQGKRFFGWISYSLAYSERFDYKEKKWIVFDRNILNNLQVVSSLNLRKNNNIGLRLQYTNGYPYTPVNEVLYYDASRFEYRPEFGETNSVMHASYIGLDVRYEKKLALKRGVVTFYVGCDRILHFLQFIEKEDGTPVYFPAETPYYNYDFSRFLGMANFPSATVGFSLEF